MSFDGPKFNIIKSENEKYDNELDARYQVIERSVKSWEGPHTFQYVWKLKPPMRTLKSCLWEVGYPAHILTQKKDEIKCITHQSVWSQDTPQFGSQNS